MRIFNYVFCLFLTTLIFGCSGSLAPTPVSDDDIVNYTGTITDGYLISSDMAYQGNINIFYPSNLPESLKIIGLRVVFSGKLIECPPNASCLAQEIKLSAIKVIDGN